MGGGSSRISPLGNSHGNHALLHQQLVEHALTRREEMRELAERGASRYNAMTEARVGAYQALREIRREDREREVGEELEMYGEDSRLQSRTAQQNREYDERNKMSREDKNRPTGRGRGRGRGRRD